MRGVSVTLGVIAACAACGAIIARLAASAAGAAGAGRLVAAAMLASAGALVLTILRRKQRKARQVAASTAGTLDAVESRPRTDAIEALAQRALLSHERRGRTLRLRYASHASAELERLVALERACCAFLQFDLRHTAAGVQLDITAPANASASTRLLYTHFLGGAAAAGSAGRTPAGQSARKRTQSAGAGS